MAASGGFNRNGTQRNSLKLDKPLSVNSNPKSSLKSKPLSSSGVRRSSTGSMGASPAAAKDDSGGWFLLFLLFLVQEYD